MNGTEIVLFIAGLIGWAVLILWVGEKFIDAYSKRAVEIAKHNANQKRLFNAVDTIDNTGRMVPALLERIDRVYAEVQSCQNKISLVNHTVLQHLNKMQKPRRR